MTDNSKREAGVGDPRTKLTGEKGEETINYPILMPRWENELMARTQTYIQLDRQTSKQTI